jgi:flagellar export protein FliJ
MKRYEFGLQRVKRVRGVEEDLAKAEFSSAEVAARTAEMRASDCKAAVDRAVDDLRGLQGSPRLEANAVITALGLIDDARRTWFDAAELAHVARARAEELRRAWQARRRDVEGLERLDERERAEWMLERDREELRIIDETAIQRAARSRRVMNVDSSGGIQ